MDKITASLRRRAINALRVAVGGKEPTPAQNVILSSLVDDMNRNTARWGKGAGQSTLRLMVALKVLEDDR